VNGYYLALFSCSRSRPLRGGASYHFYLKRCAYVLTCGLSVHMRLFLQALNFCVL